ncbi:uncharacterized protein B0I36DRAFT_337906 [Microdochium trichocladiopsis]|uniref:Uncharacterized protein n=1 Tax=Microdochium trichocladiopsis TaxID=1682393 RepID=A0A9P8XV31_9PEZI|nr:uncharacterized protein B0I36DRAFT_337906 [Microdochium trichocladiopsis]KAH7016499.1 hypothetical protein B0I36DRAFT_337906 [Microdochium trichocladiopsis]
MSSRRSWMSSRPFSSVLTNTGRTSTTTAFRCTSLSGGRNSSYSTLVVCCAGPSGTCVISSLSQSSVNGSTTSFQGQRACRRL